MPDTKYISKITLTSGDEYELKDKAAVASITANGTTVTVTKRDGTTTSFTTQDSDTTYEAATSVQPVATSAVTGISTAYARADHVHNITKATVTEALGYTPVSQSDISGISGAMHYVGTTTATITDGSTTKPADITGSGASGALANGDVIISGEKEFVWNGTKWQEFGSTGSLKALAFKDSATASYQPTGSITVTLPTASKNVVSAVSTGTAVTNVTTAPQTMVTEVTTTAQTVATGGTSTNITVDAAAETLVLPSTVISALSTTSINKVTAVNTASKNVVSNVETGTVVTDVATAAQTMVTGQPTAETFTGTTATITVS